MGVFLFWDKSRTVLHNDRTTEVEEKAKKLSEEDLEDIVKKLEEGSEVPGEDVIQNDEVSTTNGQKMTDGESQIVDEERSVENEEWKTTSGERGRVIEEQQTTDNEQRTINGEKESGVSDRLVSWGFLTTNDRKVDTVVIHSTYNPLGGDPFSVSKVLNIYKSYSVAPHYLMARDGKVYRLVEEKNVAYHAGESEMKDGRNNVNGFSIGIEVIGKDDGSPSEAQYNALRKLLADIKSRHSIKYIVGHSDIAPGRKTDPWGFDWKKIGGKK